MATRGDRAGQNTFIVARSCAMFVLLRSVVALAFAALTGCASFAPGALPPGTTIDQARRMPFGPTGEYRLPGGETRLEFNGGSFGRQTFMLDFDSHGRLVRNQQVLTEAEFAKIAPGMTSGEVLMRLGHPADVFNVGWQNLQVWNYRFYPGDCVWYQISISRTDWRVTEAALGQDPICDAPTRE